MNTSHTNHRTQIGFKVTDNKVAIIENENKNSFINTNDLNFEQMMQLKGMEQALLLLQGYFNNRYKPVMNNRDEHFFEELKKIKYRFFDPLL